MSQKYTDRNTPPPGFEIVNGGTVTTKDWVWNSVDNCWNHPTKKNDFDVIGKEVSYYHDVAKKGGVLSKTDQVQKFKWSSFCDMFGWKLVAWTSTYMAAVDSKGDTLSMTINQMQNVLDAFHAHGQRMKERS